jgi:hypothetical protein
MRKALLAGSRRNLDTGANAGNRIVPAGRVHRSLSKFALDAHDIWPLKQAPTKRRSNSDGNVVPGYPTLSLSLKRVFPMKTIFSRWTGRP